MNVLLDTNILLWALYKPEDLPAASIEYLYDTDNEFYYSIVSLWEVEIKHIKAPELMPVDSASLDALCQGCGLGRVPLLPEHIRHLSRLQLTDGVPEHKAPFDKILMCQAAVEELVFITHDSKLEYYGLECVKRV